jgi:DNA-binding IclR family transcriptional regulator
LEAVAAPVYSADGQVVGAIDVSGIAHRLQAGGGPDLVRLTKGAAADLSRRLGFRGRPTK